MTNKDTHTETHRHREGARERGSVVRRACCKIVRPELRSQYPCNKLDKSTYNYVHTHICIHTC